MTDLHTIDRASFGARTIAALVAIATVTLAWFAISWQLGNMLAMLTQPSEPGSAEIADAAIRLAPSDPSAYALKAAVDPNQAMFAAGEAVRRAPNDFRYRIQLGRVLEQSGDVVAAETEFRSAVDLAPAYASPRWHLGNFLLRLGRADAAMNELTLAAKDHSFYRDQVYGLAWDYFGKDAGRLEGLAGTEPDNIAALALFLAARGKGDDSLRVWNKLSDPEKAGQASIGRAIALGLFSQRSFPSAAEFARQMGFDPGASVGVITNPSFERPLETNEDSMFGWQIYRNDPKVEIALDPAFQHDGSRSVRVYFKSFSKTDFANLLQTVPVEGSTGYELIFWARTENVRSLVGVSIDILNADETAPIAASAALPTGSSEWREFKVPFVTPINCNGITIRTVRSACGEGCPITGSVWLDDFRLRRQ